MSGEQGTDRLPDSGLRQALIVASVSQGVSAFLFMLTTAHGIMWVWVYTAAAFWAGVGLIRLRRKVPTRGDIDCIKWGFFPLLLLAFYIVGFVWQARGR